MENCRKFAYPCVLMYSQQFKIYSCFSPLDEVCLFSPDLMYRFKIKGGQCPPYVCCYTRLEIIYLTEALVFLVDLLKTRLVEIRFHLEQFDDIQQSVHYGHRHSDNAPKHRDCS